jgi:hypothetical protein
MFRKKVEIVVAEGIVKEAILDSISAWQASSTIRTNEALWDLVYRNFPSINKELNAHFYYDPLLKKLTLMEGAGSYRFIKYKFN